MAINIKFDLNGNPELPTIILTERNGDRLGQLYVNADSVDMSGKMNSASEISFTLNKYIEGQCNYLWDKGLNCKLIYCKEWDMYFEIRVELDEETETIKTVFCTQLAQAELSQIMLYGMEINTDDDIAREDYKPNVLYNVDDPDSSILNRILDKAPHYSIVHVDYTIANIQRSFSFDDKSIVDAFSEIEKEIGCLFVYHSNSDENGKIQRTISVYDLQQNCLNVNCGYRGEFTGTCPKCGSSNIKYGYGKNTSIFVTADELASGGIQFVTDTDSVKNCFKLEAGDELMTATIRNCNPNGTDFIWYFSDDIKANMPKQLVDKIEEYDVLYDYYYRDYESNVNVGSMMNYNKLVTKYSEFNHDLQKISTPIKGYSALMNAYYNAIDLYLFLESSLMPSVEIEKTNAEQQAALLSSSYISPVAVASINNASLSTVNSAVLAMVKTIIKPTYKVKIKSSDWFDYGGEKIWKGSFTITSYADEEDTVTSQVISIVVNDNRELFVKQKINKALNQDNTDDYSVTKLFDKEYNVFCEELKKYALIPLNNFRDACQACIDIFIEQGIVNNFSNDNLNNELYDKLYKENNELYDKLYVPYFNKLLAIDAEIKVRENEINVIKGIYNSDNELITDGLMTYIEKCKKVVQNILDFEAYLGHDLWMEFCSYRRESKYFNDNYISDGLNNAELFDRALQFIEVAENEIYKSSELQHSISTSLKNLLAIPKFKCLIDSFEVGNWILVQIDDCIYKLRLLEYNINFGDFNNIKVEFSDVMRIKNGFTDLEDIFEQANSMATSYDSVKKQAKQGNEAKGTILQWLNNGLNSALVRIQNNNNEEVTYSKSGILCRSYNDITDDYSPEQLRLTHNILAFTADNWKTAKLAIGKHNYMSYESKSDDWIANEGYGVSADFVTAGQVIGSRIVGGEIFSSNYHKGTAGSSSNKPQGTYINLMTGSFDLGSGKMSYNAKDNRFTLRGVTIEWDSTNSPSSSDIEGLEEYLNQLDGRIQTYSQTIDPSIGWSDFDKENHIGDLWLNPDDGITRRWTGTKWEIVTDSELQELAASKAQIFTVTPTPPYYLGDLWVQGSTGDIMHCIKAREQYDSFNKNDWEISSKYTDDTALNDFLLGEYKDDLIKIGSQIDGKARSWYQSTDPSLTWDKNEDHEGDLWYNSSPNSQDTYIYENGAWKKTSVPKEMFDLIDGIASIYVTMPENPVVGDLLIPTSNIGNYKKGKVYKYDGKTWVEISYTDDTRANEAYNLADSAKGIAENAKSLGETLSNGLGFKTAVTGEYIISPVIAGGHLLIGDTTGTYAQITTNGTLSCANANINGTITGSSFIGGSMESTNFIGGSIKSTNYEENEQGTYIDLNNGYFEVGGGSLVYSNNIISLGKQNDTSIINLCGGLGQIKFTTIDKEVGTKGLQISTPTHDIGNINIRANNSNGQVRLYAGDDFNESSGQYSSIINSATGNISLVASNWSRDESGNIEWNDFSSIRITHGSVAIKSNSSLLIQSDSIILEPESKICAYFTSSNDTYELLRMTTLDNTNNTTTCVIGEGTNSTYIKSAAEVRLQNKNNAIMFKAYDSDTTAYNAFFEPSNDGKVTLGTSNHKWYVLYASNATIQTSDRREKENIVPLDTSELFDGLKPVQYNYINGNNKICYGLIAQDVIETMNKLGIDETQIDLVHHDFFPDEETGLEKDTYGIAYTNLIAMLIHEVQKLKQKVK